MQCAICECFQLEAACPNPEQRCRDSPCLKQRLLGRGSPLTSRRGCREKTPAALFFKYNSQLGPPYQVLVDTNFINFSIKNKASGRKQHLLQHNHCHVSSCCVRPHKSTPGLPLAWNLAALSPGDTLGAWCLEAA